jgi:pilus assembly protein Flp/PilA
MFRSNRARSSGKFFLVRLYPNKSLSPILSVATLERGNPMHLFWKFVSDDSGATAIEYSILAAGIALVIIASVNAIGTSLNTTFTSVSTALK